MITFKELRRRLDRVVCEQEIFKDISELFNLIEGTFYVFRSDTGQILAKSIPDYESAKLRASQIRKSNNLKFDQISFKMERKPATQFGVRVTSPNTHLQSTHTVFDSLGLQIQ